MEPILSDYCATCGHAKTDHPDWNAGSCRAQTRGNQFGDDDYCGCRAFVEQWCVFHAQEGDFALSAWKTADGRTYVMLKDPWEKQRLADPKLTWLAEQLPAAVNSLIQSTLPERTP